jgi:hypothetical protein
MDRENALHKKWRCQSTATCESKIWVKMPTHGGHPEPIRSGLTQTGSEGLFSLLDMERWRCGGNRRRQAGISRSRIILKSGYHPSMEVRPCAYGVTVLGSYRMGKGECWGWQSIRRSLPLCREVVEPCRFAIWILPEASVGIVSQVHLKPVSH